MPPSNPAPGFINHPDHRIAIEPVGKRWRAHIEDDVLAESDNALVLREGRYPPVVYFPRNDVAAARLVATDSKTTCPFKGEASYFRHVDGSNDVAWTYTETYDEVEAIAGYVAFYTNKVDVTDEPED